MNVHAEGSAWVHCSVDLAKKFKAALGDEKFAAIEVITGPVHHVLYLFFLLFLILFV